MKYVHPNACTVIQKNSDLDDGRRQVGQLSIHEHKFAQNHVDRFNNVNAMSTYEQRLVRSEENTVR